MTIQVGDRLPESKFRVMTADGLQVKTTDEVFKGKKVALFAVPGAYTGTCHKMHMPSIFLNAYAIKDKGVDTIAVVSVNDAFVMSAWKRDTDQRDEAVFLADGNAEFAKAIGMELDASGNGLGIRSKRYSMLVEDGVVKKLNLEPNPGKVDFLADGNGEFAKAIGMDFDASGNGLGVRSKRYSMLVEDGKVTKLNIEDAPGKCDISGGQTLLGQM